MSPRWGSTPRRTNRLTVGRNVTLTLLKSLLMASDAMKVVASLKGREPGNRGTSAVGVVTKQRD
jgi:hypothetical protein